MNYLGLPEFLWSILTKHLSDMANTQCDFFLCNRIDPLGSGSDFASFVQQIGLPSVDLTYEYDKVKMLTRTAFEQNNTINQSVHNSRGYTVRISLNIFCQMFVRTEGNYKLKVVAKK